MPNLLTLFSEDDRQWAKQRAHEQAHPKYKTDIPPSFYMAAQLGYYYGWDAVVDVRRGYHVGYNAKGEIERYSFSREEAVGLIRAAEKVHYRLALDDGRINAATNVSSSDKKYAKANAEYVNQIANRLD